MAFSVVVTTTKKIENYTTSRDATPLLEPGRVVFTPDADSVDHYEVRYARYVATADWMEQMPAAQESKQDTR
ncbi:hypothetical protein DDP54_15935 (plasmid) [Cellulomonas sp. WB94]|uniref:hypothetical protein n=1 Tax=Cellulomonas sp. WB94 TaxID=2173174 RepID=UPI000D56A242|nr:hypothetical protein [Cellulomonas sp. WB94]PVU81384.1 hypothetical protein DDP54_15935 [Cellulomonas sp. WB94]